MNTKALLLPLAILGFSLSSHAQDYQIDTTYYDQDWKAIAHPAFASYYRITIESPDGSGPNMFRDFYIGGILQAEGRYISIDKQDDSKSIFDGKCTNYYRNGQISAIHNYNYGKAEGLQYDYYESGKIMTEAEYKDNEPCGKYIMYSESGKKQQEVNFKDGKEDGKAYTYYENGNIENEFTFVSGTQTGPYKQYYENGKIKIDGVLTDGVPNGYYNAYNEKGVQTHKGTYKNGKLNGDFYQFDPESGVTFYANMTDDAYSKYTYLTSDGYQMDYDQKTNNPIYTTPSSSEQQRYMDNGSVMPYYVCNGILVGMKYTNVRDYGKYAMLEITIINRLDTDFEFDPTEIMGEEQGENGKTLYALSAYDYDKKVKNKQAWASFGNALGNAAAAYNAGQSTSTTTYSGGVNNTTGYAGAAVGVYGNNTGYRSAGAAAGVGASSSSTRYGGSSTTTTYDGTAAYMVGQMNRQQQANYDAQLAADRAAHQQGYLKKQTISRGSSISGYVMLPYSRKDIEITIPVHGVCYSFLWGN